MEPFLVECQNLFFLNYEVPIWLILIIQYYHAILEKKFILLYIRHAIFYLDIKNIYMGRQQMLF